LIIDKKECCQNISLEEVKCGVEKRMSLFQEYEAEVKVTLKLHIVELRNFSSYEWKLFQVRVVAGKTTAPWSYAWKLDGQF
jgi:hypothetical protein